MDTRPSRIAVALFALAVIGAACSGDGAPDVSTLPEETVTAPQSSAQSTTPSTPRTSVRDVDLDVTGLSESAPPGRYETDLVVWFVEYASIAEFEAVGNLITAADSVDEVWFVNRTAALNEARATLADAGHDADAFVSVSLPLSYRLTWVGEVDVGLVRRVGAMADVLSVESPQVLLEQECPVGGVDLQISLEHGVSAEVIGAIEIELARRDLESFFEDEDAVYDHYLVRYESEIGVYGRRSRSEFGARFWVAGFRDRGQIEEVEEAMEALDFVVGAVTTYERHACD